MKGISEQKAKEDSIRYRTMYERWLKEELTLEQLGNEYELTKQRAW